MSISDLTPYAPYLCVALMVLSLIYSWFYSKSNISALNSTVEGEEGAKCPFGYGGPSTASLRSQQIFAEFKEKQMRVILLYEDYIHLPALRAIWDNPVTAYPRMEPYFASACHGLELCFLLLAEFSSDKRIYLSKRPRMELVVRDIIAQCHLLSDLLDGELEDTSTKSVASFESHKPPVTDNPGSAVSPGLSHLHSVMERVLMNSTSEERASMCVMIRSVVSTFTALFSNGTLGLGIEFQLNELGKLAGLVGCTLKEGRRYLDYALLVRPQVVASTLFDEEYRHDEDFFFRTVHLGTDCWAFVAVSRVVAAKAFAAKRQWYQAAIQIRYAAAILNYLGDHVLMLTSMVLRDYLELKVEIQGTSGEGSLLVKSFRSLITSLADTLFEALTGGDEALTGGDDALRNASPADAGADFESGLSYVYARPETFPGIYEYCKALETIESCLLGGFYYKHFLLANNVIGSSAKGTMDRSVAALKATFENHCFPILDKIRAKLGAEIDAELSHNKGLIMDRIAKKHSVLGHSDLGIWEKNSDSGSALTSAVPAPASSPERATHLNQLRKGVYERCRYAERGPISRVGSSRQPSSSGEANVGRGGGGGSGSIIGSAKAVDGARPAGPPNSRLSGDDLKGLAEEMTADVVAQRDRARRSMYDETGVSSALIARKKLLCQAHDVPALQFLDHAYGFVPPMASEAALQEVYSEHCGLGNFVWGRLFSETMPQAATNVKNLLGLPSSNASSVAFAHNSHELVCRLLSTKLDRFLGPVSAVGGLGSTSDKLVVVTSDTEFFSFTRQLNRLLEGGGKQDCSRVRVVTIAAEPLHSFSDRFVEAVAATFRSEGRVDLVYVSQISFTQKTLLTSPADFVSRVRSVLLADGSPAANCNEDPLIMVDGYHGFGALPTSLVGVDAIYLGGVLKHVGGGANLCFAVVPPCYSDLRPLLTGWLADVSVLGPGSHGVSIGSDVGYTPGLALMGSTPAFHSPILVFNHVMHLWRAHKLTVAYAHQHVMALQQRFLAGLAGLEGRSRGPNMAINMAKLVKASRVPGRCEVEDEAYRSHTLVFLQASPEEASAAVKTLRDQGIGIDCRGSLVRIGFGLNHNPEDVDRILSAIRPM